MSEKYVVVEYEEYHKYKDLVEKLKSGYTVVEKMNILSTEVPTWQFFTLSPEQAVEQLTYKLRDVSIESKNLEVKYQNTLAKLKELKQGNFLTKLAFLFSKEQI